MGVVEVVRAYRFALDLTPAQEDRQLNAALHRIAITQARLHPPAQTLLERRRANGDGKAESLRVLKRRLSDVVYQALRRHDAQAAARPQLAA